jgi:hypothetical protein
MKKMFFDFIYFLLEHNIMFIIVTLPLLFLVSGLIRINIGINLISDPTFFIVLIGEVVSFFLIFSYNLFFLIRIVFIKNNVYNAFFSLFLKNLKTYDMYQKILLISHTLFYSIPIKIY